MIVSVRLGLNNIEPEYFPAIKACFQLPQCVGLLGGKPNFALYFVGTTHSEHGESDDSLIFLDPHFVQQAVKTPQDLKHMKETYFSGGRSAKKISMHSLDPILGIGLLVRNKQDLEQLKLVFSHGELSKLATWHDTQPEHMMEASMVSLKNSDMQASIDSSGYVL